MKKFFNTMLCAMMMAACSTAVQAQDAPSKKQRKSREQVAEAQARHIAHSLALDDATAQQFIQAFQDYQKEVWALGPKVHPGSKKNQTDAEAEKAIKSSFEHSQKILDLREKYYQRYSQFLTPKQIQRVYKLEKKAMKRIAKHRQMKKGSRSPQHHRRP